MSLKVENVVASIDLHGEIDVEKVANELDSVQYNSAVFPGNRLQDGALWDDISNLFIPESSPALGQRALKRLGKPPRS